jgi:ABC-type antimicrobial peptide transport system permease subunit
MVNSVERALRQIDSRPQFMTWVVRERIDFHRSERTRAAWVMTAAATLALLLGVVGIYGVTSFSVNQRMREIGVRLAIGATGKDVIWLLSKEGLRPVGVGLAAGLSVGIVVARLASRELSAISPYDPMAFGAAVLLLGGSALVAILIPARRASRTNPTTILRQT